MDWKVVGGVVVGVGVLGGIVWVLARRTSGGELGAWTISQIRRANERSGSYFFSPGAMRFFRSRIGRRVFEGPGGVYFVTSEQFVYNDPRGGGSQVHPRKYSVKKFDPATGEVDAVVEFQEFSTSEAAARRARVLATAGS